MLSRVAARRLDAAERAHLASLTSAGGVTFASASYESRLLGAFDLHATNLDHAVLIETDAPPIRTGRGDRLRWIVTPDDSRGFLSRALQRQRPRQGISQHIRRDNEIAPQVQPPVARDVPSGPRWHAARS